MHFIRQSWRQIVLIIGLSVALALGAIGLLDFSDIVPTVAALVAGIVAFSINETVQERRRREDENKLRKEREETYLLLVSHLLQSFTGGPKTPEEVVRRNISVWGSKELLQSYSEWRAAIRPALVSDGRIPPDLRPTIQQSLAKVIIAVRSDLNLDLPEVDEVAAIVFDDYRNIEVTRDESHPSDGLCSS